MYIYDLGTRENERSSTSYMDDVIDTMLYTFEAILPTMKIGGWLAVLSHPVGNPKRKVWWAQRQVSLSMKPRFNRTSRRKKQLPKVDASWLGDDSRQFVYGAYLGVALHQQQRGTCTQQHQSTLPQLAVRLSISRFAVNKRLNVSCRKIYLFARK
jgi:hypothetical protein